MRDYDWIFKVPMKDIFADPSVGRHVMFNYHTTSGNAYATGCADLMVTPDDYKGEQPDFKTFAKTLSHLADNPKREQWVNEMRGREIERVTRLRRQEELNYYERMLWEAAWAGKHELLLDNPTYQGVQEICEHFGLTFVKKRNQGQFYVKW